MNMITVKNNLPNEQLTHTSPNIYWGLKQLDYESIKNPWGSIGIVASSDPKVKLGQFAMLVGYRPNQFGSADVYLLNSGKVTSRSKFVPVALTSDIIQLMNQLSDRDPILSWSDYDLPSSPNVVAPEFSDFSIKEPSRTNPVLPIQRKEEVEVSSPIPVLPIQREEEVPVRENKPISAVPAAIPVSPAVSKPNQTREGLRDRATLKRPTKLSASCMIEVVGDFSDDNLLVCERGTIKDGKIISMVAYSFNVGLLSDDLPPMGDLSIKDVMALPQAQKDLALAAIALEFKTLNQLQTWAPIRMNEMNPIQKKNIIPCKMFVKVKRTGVYKARLVAGGHMQNRESYDETDITSPTVTKTALFMNLGIASYQNRPLWTMDIGSAFVHSDLKNPNIVMRISPNLAKILVGLFPHYQEYLTIDGCIFVSLKKALYGLAESASLWYDNIADSLQTLGFTCSVEDPAVFFRSKGKSKTTICLHVDDLLGSDFGTDSSKEIFEFLMNKYKKVEIHRLDDKNTLSYLGMNVSKDGHAIILDQKPYIDDLKRRFPHLVNIKYPVTPSSNASLELRNGNSVDVTQYKSQLMSVSYLGLMTRPDLLMTVSYLSNRQVTPNEHDQAALDRLTAYVFGTIDMKLRIDARDLIIRGSCDASFGVHSDKKSHSGWIIFIGGALIKASSKKQPSMTQSSTEAELITLNEIKNELLWVRRMMIEQGYLQLEPTVVEQDNLSTIQLANSGRPGTKRTRHYIGIKHFAIQESIIEKQIILQYVPTEEMIPDTLTKPLQGVQFEKMRAGLNLIHPDIVVLVTMVQDSEFYQRGVLIFGGNFGENFDKTDSSQSQFYQDLMHGKINQ